MVLKDLLLSRVNFSFDPLENHNDTCQRMDKPFAPHLDPPRYSVVICHDRGDTPISSVRAMALLGEYVSPADERTNPLFVCRIDRGSIWAPGIPSCPDSTITWPMPPQQPSEKSAHQERCPSKLRISAWPVGPTFPRRRPRHILSLALHREMASSADWL